jgi:hypothetical protein
MQERDVAYHGNILNLKSYQISRMAWGVPQDCRGQVQLAWVRFNHLYSFMEANNNVQLFFHRRGGSMKRILHTSSTLFFIMTILFANPYTVLANEGDGGHGLEKEVNGYHVTLASQNEWVKGENTIVVTLTDSMGMPLSKAEVEILITPKSDEHAEDLHGTEPQQDAVPEMDMGHDHSQETVPDADMSAPATETPGMLTHEEENASPITMMESDEHGIYVLETHLESSGKNDVHVMFHVNGEMLQADFVVEVSGTSSRTVVLWSFGVINVALIASASIMKKQPVTTRGK